MELLLVYLIIVNAAGFLLMLADKQKAKKNRWRISEATLITFSIIGGSLGSLIGMRLFRHKTRHPKFNIGLPIIFSSQLVLLLIFILQR